MSLVPARIIYYGMQIDHILTETHQHLWRSLTTNTAVDIRLARGNNCRASAVGDGVSEEDYAVLLSGMLHGSIVRRGSVGVVRSRR